MTQSETMHYDIIIVGAGPAGLASAIRLKQLAQETQQSLRVCVLEKGAEVGAHILSGAVIDPRALNELLPDWAQQQAPIVTQAQSDHFQWLTAKRRYHLPTPKPLRNHGNYIISLGQLCRWLALQAEALGVEIFPGFAASKILYGPNQQVIGVTTGDFGRDKQGNKTERYQAGIAIHAKQTLFAEGCRGSLTKQLIKTFQLDQDACPQTYGLGLKELWAIDPEKHQAGKITHTVGWPLDQRTYGGSFIYHYDNNLVSIGFVIGLDYQNPHLSPFDEFQRFKTHPTIRPLLENGKRIAYGSRALVEGGVQALPQLSVPGAMIIGDSAGFLNVPRIKGSHNAMKSGMCAAEVFFEALQQDADLNQALPLRQAIEQSWIWPELHQVRNIRPGFKRGLWLGLTHAAIDTYLLRGKAPWTLKHKADHKQLKKAEYSKKIIYPKPDGVITFDRMSSVYLSNTFHNENQPCHLQLKKKSIPITVNYQDYDSPEQRYCPAGVYEILQNDQGQPILQINAQNCIHCKCCDIKDPLQNINWVPPEGGGGPNYGAM